MRIADQDRLRAADHDCARIAESHGSASAAIQDAQRTGALIGGFYGIEVLGGGISLIARRFDNNNPQTKRKP